MNYREKECPKCNGERWLENTEDGSNYKCDLCNGSGLIRWITNDDCKTGKKRYFRYDEKFDVVVGTTYLELDNECYALRQLSKVGDRFIASNRKDKEYDFWLAEGTLDMDDLGPDVAEISASEFEYVWSRHCFGLLKAWEEDKYKYSAGKKVQGTIQCFYPQGVIISFEDDVIGIADYEECRNSTTPDKVYPSHKVEAIISGYDEQNMWIVLKEARIVY